MRVFFDALDASLPLNHQFLNEYLCGRSSIYRQHAFLLLHITARVVRTRRCAGCMAAVKEQMLSAPCAWGTWPQVWIFFFSFFFLPLFEYFPSQHFFLGLETKFSQLVMSTKPNWTLIFFISCLPKLHWSTLFAELYDLSIKNSNYLWNFLVRKGTKLHQLNTQWLPTKASLAISFREEV